MFLQRRIFLQFFIIFFKKYLRTQRVCQEGKKILRNFWQMIFIACHKIIYEVINLPLRALKFFIPTLSNQKNVSELQSMSKLPFVML